MKLPPQSINNWIDSNINPNDASLKKIAAYFNIKVSDLMDDKCLPVAAGSLKTQTESGFDGLMGKAGAVLSSGTIYAEALASNIHAFYQAVNEQKRSVRQRVAAAAVGVVCGKEPPPDPAAG
jgi:hypothetical protein